jgi:hypothetical protein
MLMSHDDLHCLMTVYSTTSGELNRSKTSKVTDIRRMYKAKIHLLIKSKIFDSSQIDENVTLTPETKSCIPNSPHDLDSVVPNSNDSNDSLIESLREKLIHTEIEISELKKKLLKKSVFVRKSKHLLKNNNLEAELIEKLLFIEHNQSNTKYSYAQYIIRNLKINLRTEVEINELTDLVILIISNIKEITYDNIQQDEFKTVDEFLCYFLNLVFKKQLSLLKVCKGIKRNIKVLIEKYNEYYMNFALKYLLDLLLKGLDCDYVDLLEVFPVEIDDQNLELVRKLLNVECSQDMHLHVICHVHKWVAVDRRV